MLSRTICSFGQLSCTMQSAGPDLWSWLFRKGKFRKLDFTWKIQYMLCWRCQLYTAVSPQLQNAISLEAPMCRATLTSKPSALAKQENHLLNPSSGKDAMINAQGLWAEATATARQPHGSLHRQCQLFHLSKSSSSSSSAWPFHLVLRIQDKVILWVSLKISSWPPLF